MTTIFFITLGVGAGFVVLTLILGQAFGASSMSFDGGSASPFRLIFIAVFLTTFGGVVCREHLLPMLNCCMNTGVHISILM